MSKISSQKTWNKHNDRYMSQVRISVRYSGIQVRTLGLRPPWRNPRNQLGYQSEPWTAKCSSIWESDWFSHDRVLLWSPAWLCLLATKQTGDAIPTVSALDLKTQKVFSTLLSPILLVFQSSVSIKGQFYVSLHTEWCERYSNSELH